MAGIAKLSIPTSVAVINYEYTFGNFASTNAFSTTNIWSTNVYVIGNMVGTANATPGLTTLSVTGNVFASNALVVPRLYANTLSLSNLGSTITLTGNVTTTTNAFATNNVFVAGKLIVNAATNPGVTRVSAQNLYVANAIATTNVFTGNLVATGNFMALGLPTFTSLNVIGNTAVSNAITTTNVFAGNVLATGNMTITSLPRLTTLNVTGNAYVSNAVTSTNVFATGRMVITGGPTGNSTFLYGGANLYVSNAVTTTNVWTNNVYATGNMAINGLPSLTTLNVTGNVLVANTVTTTNAWTNNVTATGQMSFAGLPTLTTVSILANAVVGNTVTTTNVWTTNLISTGQMTIAGLPALTTLSVTGNLVASNTIVATNVFLTNLYATGNVFIAGGDQTTGLLTANVLGNAYVANAIVTTNVFTMAMESNTMYITGNVTVSNAIQTQNIWVANAYASNLFIGTTAMYADPSTKSIGANVWTSTQAATLTRASHLPLYAEYGGSAPPLPATWTGDMYFDNSTLYKYIGSAAPLWCPISPINVTTPSMSAIGTQNITTSATTAIQVSQTVDASSVGPVTWSISGKPSDVFLSNTSSRGCTIVVPASIKGSTTSTVTVTATNSAGSSQQVFSLGITMPTISIGLSREFPVSNASVLRQFTSTDGDYWYQPQNNDSQPIQLYTNFSNAPAGRGYVLVARGRESTDWWTAQNYSSVGTTLTSANLTTNTPIAVLSDRFVNALIGGNWRNMKMLVNRRNGGDSWYITGTSDGPFSWNWFRSFDGTNTVNNWSPSIKTRAAGARYTALWKGGTLTGSTADTQYWTDLGQYTGNDCSRLFTGWWSGHGSYQGWSGGASCTPAGGFQAGTEGHYLQLVNCYIEC